MDTTHRALLRCLCHCLSKAAFHVVRWDSLQDQLLGAKMGRLERWRVILEHNLWKGLFKSAASPLGAQRCVPRTQEPWSQWPHLAHTCRHEGSKGHGWDLNLGSGGTMSQGSVWVCMHTFKILSWTHSPLRVKNRPRLALDYPPFYHMSAEQPHVTGLARCSSPRMRGHYPWPQREQRPKQGSRRVRAHRPASTPGQRASIGFSKAVSLQS